MKGWGMTITEDAVYSIDEVRERFGAEDLDVNTDIATTVLLTETEGGLLLKLADYPIALMVEEPTSLDDAAEYLGLERGELARFGGEVNLSIYPGEDDEGTRTGIGLQISIYGDEGDSVYGFVDPEDGTGSWTLDGVARTFGIATDARVWDVREA